MTTPVIQFSWSADEAKTIYTALASFKLILTQADKNQIKKALSPSTAAAIDDLVETLIEEPDRIRLIQSTMDRLSAWLIQHDAGVRNETRRLGLPDEPPIG